MTVHIARLVVAVLLATTSALAQRGGPPEPLPPGQTTDPFPAPIAATEGVITVGVREFASVPDIDGVAARMMNLVNEPGTRRLFVNDMRGPLYSVSYDGKAVTLYVDINAPAWGVSVQSMGRERGFQSFAFHPQFGQPGTPGFGKFYTYTDTTNQTPAPDFTTTNPASTPRHRDARVDGEDASRRHLRRRPAARAVPPSAAVRQPQRRAHGLQSARGARQSRVRLALHRRGRWRQRRRSDAICRRTWARRSARSSASIRSARQRQQEVRHSRRAIRS